MLSLRKFVTLAGFVLASVSASAQTGPMLTPSAFIPAPGNITLDVFGMTIGKEPNFLTFAQAGTLQERTRVDGPVVRLTYVPSARAEFTAEFNGQTYAINDPRYGKTISDFGDATLRAKLGLARGEVSAAPAVALQFEVTLPNTSFGNGLGPNTLRMESALIVGYKTEKLTVNGRAGLAIQDEPLRLHEQRDFASLSASIAYQVAESVEIFADAGGFMGDGVPGAIARREARAGVQYQRNIFGKETKLFIAGRRGLVDFQGKWGVIAGFSTTLRPGSEPTSAPVVVPAPVSIPN